MSMERKDKFKLKGCIEIQKITINFNEKQKVSFNVKCRQL